MMITANLSFTFPSMTLGSHQTPWDLRILLFRGAANIPRKDAMLALEMNELPGFRQERLALIKAFHESITTLIAKGLSRSTIISILENLWKFYRWSDQNYIVISEDNIVEIFKKWVEYQLQRNQVHKEISAMHGYREVTKIANLIALSLKLPGNKPGKYLVSQTRMRKPNHSNRAPFSLLNTVDLNLLWEFGHTLKKICEKLDMETLRGPLPIIVKLKQNNPLILSGCLQNPLMETHLIEDHTVRKTAEKARSSLGLDERLIDQYKRISLINLRIESELLIFIAQTGMNLSQAATLQRDSYRWQSDGDEFNVFRVYKARRNGEAIFRCYKAYRKHFYRYLTWLEESELSSNDSRLFPLLNRAKLKAAGSAVRFYTSKSVFKSANIEFFGPKILRKIRVNWLLKQYNDVTIAAEQMAHDKTVLLREYAQFDYQEITAEIINFYNSLDKEFSAPGPGVCSDNSRIPVQISMDIENTPQPDCISPEGCLFCSKHRDIMSEDYCWKLASHGHLKLLETNLYKPSKKQDIHPSYYVIERINKKLDVISSGSKIRAMWVSNAYDLIKAGRYHPHWNSYIQLLEVMI